MSGDRNSEIGTLTVLQGRSLGYARDDGAKRYQNFAALLIFTRRTTPAEPFEPIEPAPPLSQTIKGRPEGRALNPISLFSTVSPGELFLDG